MLLNSLPLHEVAPHIRRHHLDSPAQSPVLVPVPMLMPETTPIHCPKCQRPILMTLQAALQARDLGVTVECRDCGEAWLYKSHPEPVFGPLASPKRRRGRPIQSAEIDPSNIEVKPQNEIDPNHHCRGM